MKSLHLITLISLCFYSINVIALDEYGTHKELSCSSIMNALQQRLAKAYDALEQEWNITAENREEIEKFIAKLDEQDKQEKSIHLRSQFPEDFTEAVIQKFHEVGCNNAHVDIMYVPAVAIGQKGVLKFDACVNREIIANDGFIDADNKKIKTDFLQVGPYTIKFGSKFFKYNGQEQEGTLLHEIKGHVVHHDSAREALLFFSACIYDPSLLEDQSRFFDSDSFRQYKKAIEARADQIPACESIENARLIEASLKKSSKKNSSKPGVTIVEDSSHDPEEDRLAVVTHIRQLKEAETIS